MRHKRYGTRARCIRLAIFVAFLTQGVTVYTLLPGPAKLGYALPIARQEIASIASMGLISLGAAYLAIKIFIYRRVRFETLLSRSQAFARGAFDAVPAHIAIVNESGVILSVNESWLNSARELGADHSKSGEGANYLAECDRAAARGCQEAATIGIALRDILNKGAGEFVLEYTAHSANRRRWFQVRISPFKGNVVAAVITHEDVTDRKVADERHENAKREAEAANAAKSAFIANISHEIRTPMNAILGYADMLLDNSSTAEHRHDCVKVIRRNGEHLLAIINDILDISKVEACRMSAERIECDLPQLIADVIGLTRPKAIEKRLKFEVTFDELIPKTILTDPVRAKQVLVNLVGNAIKFTESGSVRLHVAREVSYFGHTISFGVSDTGIGMTPEQMTKLFQPFSQADASTTRKFGGTGLGLTISKRLAQILGGDITVESRQGAGSTFTFTLDGGAREGVELLKNFTQSQLDVADLTLQTEAQEIRLRGKVLLAEDGEDNQHMLITFLEQAGLCVTLATNGEAALNMAQGGDFDLVLMDMQMPIMDGYRATGELRKAGFDKPIIALTAHAMAEDRLKCIAAGCSEYLSKPIDRQKLLQTCATFLPADIYPVKPAMKGTAAASAVAETSDRETSHDAEPTSLRSNLVDDPRVMRVLDRFISHLPQRVAEFEQCLNEGDLEALRHAVHNLKGAGSGYGFPALTQQSANAEEALKAQRSLEEIRREVDQLVGLIRKVDGYRPPSNENVRDKRAALLIAD